MVRAVGLEPTLLSKTDFKFNASTIERTETIGVFRHKD
jgi:hypothetical protein